MFDRPIRLLEEALEYKPGPNEPSLGGYFFLTLGDALHRLKQKDRANKIFQVTRGKSLLESWGTTFLPD